MAVISYQLSSDENSVIKFEAQNVLGQAERLVGRGGVEEVIVKSQVDGALASVREFGEKILHTVQELRPSEAQVEFGVVFKGETNAIIAKSSAEGHVKITLTWKSSGKSAEPN